MIECENGRSRGSLYTGYTLDIERRYRQHCEGKGAKYTRACKPRRLVACWLVLSDAADAQRVEYFVKKLDRKMKDRLVLDAQHLCELTEELEVGLEVIDLSTLKI